MNLFDRGLIRLVLQLVSAQAEVRLGRIEYLEPFLPWFYLSLAISFHSPSLFLPRPKFLLVPKCFFSELSFDWVA
jgi:hypothetical protein